MLTPGKHKLAVGRILKTHGIKGELNVELTDEAEPDEDFAPGAPVIMEIDGLDVPFFVASARQRGSSSVLLTLDDVDTETDAAELAGHTIYVYIDPADADNGDSLTAGDLVGYEMADAETGAAIGRIGSLTELTPGAWYFSLEDGRLVPAVDEFIVDIDHERRRVEMTLPAGLLEL